MTTIQRRATKAGLWLFGLILVAAATSAQYTAPGSLALEKRRPRDFIREAVDTARFRLGPVRLEPVIFLGNLGFSSNVYDSLLPENRVSDFRATARLGLDSFLKLGPKVVLHGFGFASYDWWSKEDELRELSPTYGLRLFGLGNRMTVQLEGGTVEQQRYLGSELFVPAQVRTDRLALDLDGDLAGPWTVFASLGGTRTRHSGAAEDRIPGADFSSLDRDSESLRLGVRYSLPLGWTIGVGFDWGEDQLLEDPEGRSNTYSAPVLLVLFTGNRLNVRSDVSQRQLDFDRHQNGKGFDQTTGSIRLGWKFSEKTSATAYAGQEVVYSLLRRDSIIESRRTGLALGYQLREYIRLGAFGETGHERYRQAASGLNEGEDDLAAYGISARVNLPRRVVMEVSLLTTERDSPVLDLNRTQRTLGVSLNYRGNILPW